MLGFSLDPWELRFVKYLSAGKLNKRDQLQQEAIRKLARISATRSGGFRVDSSVEQAERDRISRLVDPQYRGHSSDADHQKASPPGSIFQILKFAILIAILVYIGIGL